jgi:hypothetical protein
MWHCNIDRLANVGWARAALTDDSGLSLQAHVHLEWPDWQGRLARAIATALPPADAVAEDLHLVYGERVTAADKAAIHLALGHYIDAARQDLEGAGQAV